MRAEARVLTGLYSALTCEAADFAWLFSFVVLIRDPALPWERRPHCPTFGGIFGLDCANPWDACLAWREYAFDCLGRQLAPEHRDPMGHCYCRRHDLAGQRRWRI
jgi:hypothetical protein